MGIQRAIKFGLVLMILFLLFCRTETSEVRDTTVEVGSKEVSKETEKTETPKNAAELYNDSGNLKRENKDFKGAIEDFTKAISINPKYANAFYNRALTKSGLENHKEAIEDLNKAILINPEDSDFYVFRGDVKGDLEDHKGAIEDYSKAIKLNPKNAEAYNRRGNAKYSLKKYKEAIEDYSQCIALNSKHADAFEYRGYSKVMIGDFEIALKNENITKEDFDETMNWITSTQDIDSMAKAAKIKADEILDLRFRNNGSKFITAWFNIREFGSSYDNAEESVGNEFQYEKEKESFKEIRNYKYVITHNYIIWRDYDFQKKGFYFTADDRDLCPYVCLIRAPKALSLPSEPLFSISPEKAEKYKDVSAQSSIVLSKITPKTHIDPNGKSWKKEERTAKIRYFLIETLKYRFVFDGEVYKNY